MPDFYNLYLDKSSSACFSPLIRLLFMSLSQFIDRPHLYVIKHVILLGSYLQGPVGVLEVMKERDGLSFTDF